MDPVENWQLFSVAARKENFASERSLLLQALHVLQVRLWIVQLCLEMVRIDLKRMPPFVEQKARFERAWRMCLHSPAFGSVINGGRPELATEHLMNPLVF